MMPTYFGFKQASAFHTEKRHKSGYCVIKLRNRNKNLKFASPWSYVYFKQVSYGIIKLIVTD